MNKRRIFFSGVVTSAVGVGLGLVILQLAPSPYSSSLYSHLKRDYLIIGGIAGLLLGASQETVRQLKRQCDEDEAIANQCNKTSLTLVPFESGNGHASRIIAPLFPNGIDKQDELKP